MQQAKASSLISFAVSEKSGHSEEDGVALDVVEGFPDWRKVDRGDDPPYYFHIVTQETRWDFPTSN